MQQSNVIFGSLLLAYIVFITLRGELPAYITILRGGGAVAGSSSSPSNNSALPSSIPPINASTLESGATSLIQGSGIQLNAPNPNP